MATKAFQAVPINDKVYWVGAVDWAIRDFHGYETNRGTTYNAYLVLGEKVALFDTVKAGFADEMFHRIASVIDPSKIDVMVSNHAEPDHSGSIVESMQRIQPDVVYTSKNGQKALQEHFGIGDQVTPVDEGQTIDLGGVSVVFAETRMCHWPDSMVSYLPEYEMLISQDAFGMHLASFERFADQLDPSLLYFEAAKYYANILLPLSTFVAKSLQKVGDLGLKISTICPDHGPIWRQNPEQVVGWYAKWAEQKRTDKVIVLYDTMWKSSEKMARAVGEGVGHGGGRPTLMSSAVSHRSEVATRLLDAGGLIVGAPTLNNELFPRIADVLTYIKGLRPKGLIGAAFGSYGWSGESIAKLNEYLAQMEVEVVADPVKGRYFPDGDIYDQCFELGKAVAAKLPS